MAFFWVGWGKWKNHPPPNQRFPGGFQQMSPKNKTWGDDLKVRIFEPVGIAFEVALSMFLRVGLQSAMCQAILTPSPLRMGPRPTCVFWAGRCFSSITPHGPQDGGPIFNNLAIITFGDCFVLKKFFCGQKKFFCVIIVPRIGPWPNWEWLRSRFKRYDFF